MKVAIFGNYGVHNLGDDLILRGLLNDISALSVISTDSILSSRAESGVVKGRNEVERSRIAISHGIQMRDFSASPHSLNTSASVEMTGRDGRDDRVVIFCGNPTQVAHDFGFEAHPFFPSGLRSWFKYLFSSAYRAQIKAGFEALRSCDRIILGGGGLLVDRRLKAIMLWWQQLRWIKKTGKPFEFLGVSLELNRIWTRWLFRPYLKAAARITVRDTSSLALLASLGIHAELVDDFAWHAPLSVISTDSSVVKEREEWRNLALRELRDLSTTPLSRTHSASLEMTQNRKISLSLCQWGLGRRQQNVLRTYISERRKQGFELVGLAFQTTGDDDRKIFQHIDPSLLVVSEPDTVMEELSTSSLLLGMRYHSLMLALRLNIPFIALTYQEKVTALMRDQGIGNQTILLKDLDSVTLEKVFFSVISTTLCHFDPFDFAPIRA